MHHFFAMLSRMKYINRWGLMRNTRNENICEHSLDVAVISHALALIGNKRYDKNYNTERAAMLGIMHDAPEIITGDMPTPVKYHSKEISKAYKEVESIAVDRLTSMLPEDFRQDYEDLFNFSGDGDEELKKLVKAADKISAIIKCIEEKKSGNSEFSKAEQALRKAVGDMDMPETSCFMEEFLPSYCLTLDELG